MKKIVLATALSMSLAIPAFAETVEGVSINSTALPPELTASNLLAVKLEGVSVSPKKVVGLEST